ncbi:MAG: translation initiation factor IF-2 [Conexivisphaerales archaeon]
MSVTLEKNIRQPIIVVLGHVDSGKTSLLDKMRGTAVQEREAGGITQQIGASFFPPEVLLKVCGPLVKIFGGNVRIPGLLVIDTPGHEAFANLRLRGGSAADIAILVVDATKGLEAQSFESIEILKSRKVPFVVALNKIDLLAGWLSDPKRLVKDASNYLQKATIELLDEAIYKVVGQLSQLGFASEAYYRVKDFAREVAIVPVSARTGEGIAELLAVLVGLSQQYLTKRLQVSAKQTRGIVLEVEETPGLGPTANVILIDGVLKIGSTVLVAKRNSVDAVKIRALLLPKPLDEMRDPRDRFEPVEEVHAAAGVKLAAQGLEGVLAGSPIIGVASQAEEEESRKAIMAEVRSALVETEQEGLIVKANTLGSLEALTSMLKRFQIPIRIADIGPVTKNDVVQAASVAANDRYLGVVLAFSVKVLEDAREEAERRGVRVFTDSVIYSLIDNYLTWSREEKEKEQRITFSSITPPCKFSVLRGFVFRRSNPAIFGVEILAGRLRQKARVMNSSGEEVGQVQQIQSEGQEVSEAGQGLKVAISMKEPVVGRQIKEGETLYTLPESDEARTLLQRFYDMLSEEERSVLNEIIQVRRKVQTLYAF